MLNPSLYYISFDHNGHRIVADDPLHSAILQPFRIHGHNWPRGWYKPSQHNIFDNFDKVVRDKHFGLLITGKSCKRGLGMY